ncbi:hypothetical protein HC891_24890 [Candidatus Gracilibacteria bacterium]|nr:hypothetical protein [Candidatus Gracilibacteria bacterium]
MTRANAAPSNASGYTTLRALPGQLITAAAQAMQYAEISEDTELAAPYRRELLRPLRQLAPLAPTVLFSQAIQRAEHSESATNHQKVQRQPASRNRAQPAHSSVAEFGRTPLLASSNAGTALLQRSALPLVQPFESPFADNVTASSAEVAESPFNNTARMRSNMPGNPQSAGTSAASIVQRLGQQQGSASTSPQMLMVRTRGELRMQDAGFRIQDSGLGSSTTLQRAEHRAQNTEHRAPHGDQGSTRQARGDERRQEVSSNRLVGGLPLIESAILAPLAPDKHNALAEAPRPSEAPAAIQYVQPGSALQRMLSPTASTRPQSRTGSVPGPLQAAEMFGAETQAGPGPAFDAYGNRVYDTTPKFETPLQRTLESRSAGAMALLRPISRLPEAGSTAAPGSIPATLTGQRARSSTSNESDESPQNSNAAPNIEALAQHVYDLLRRRLQIDSERRGRFGTPFEPQRRAVCQRSKA